jgi:hypothetical protein
LFKRFVKKVKNVGFFFFFFFFATGGFIGICFQHNAGLQEGDGVFVINGYLAPMMLRRENGEGRQFRMMGIAYLFGASDFDLESLVEEGIFQEEEFEIV